MKKTLLSTIIIMAMTITSCFAQLNFGSLTLNGYVQTDLAVAGKDGSTFIGSSYKPSIDGEQDYFFRYGVRRGLLRGTFTSAKGKGILEITMGEGGIIPLVALLEYDFLPWMSLQAGLMNIDFGYELMYPSSALETLERSMHTKTLFPLEHDLGVKLAMDIPTSSLKHKLYLSLSAMSGNGINRFNDRRPVFMSHLKYSYIGEQIKFVLGTSYYEGEVNNTSNTVYNVINNTWVGDEVSPNNKNTRRYINFHAELDLPSPIGNTALRSECTFGRQPSRLDEFKSQYGDSYNISTPFAYNRHFLGAYLYYIQQVNNCPFSFIVKCAYLDHNTKLDKDHITNPTDAAFLNLGLGLRYQYDSHISAELFADFYSNETNNIVKQLNDNACHLRLQYKF